MNKVTKNSKITLHFKGTSSDGSIFVNTWNSKEPEGKPEPFKVALGNGMLLSSLENALVGMTTGEKKSIELSVEDAHGHRNPNAIFAVPRNLFPDDINLVCGMPVSGKNQDSGDTISAIVLAFDNENVMLDHNHPLCEHSLKFDVEIVDINDTE